MPIEQREQRHAEALAGGAEEAPERGVDGDVAEDDVDADGDHREAREHLAEAPRRAARALEPPSPDAASRLAHWQR